MKNYTVKVIKNFTDAHDESVKYIKGETIIVSEERALELFSSNTPVIKYLSHELDGSDVATEIENLKSEIEELKTEKEILSTNNETLTTEIENLKSEIEELKKTKSAKAEK